MSDRPSPYRNSRGEPLRDTGRAPKYEDEKGHMRSASAFDTLVSANLSLVRWLKISIAAMLLCSAISGGVAVYSSITIRDLAARCR